MGRWVLSPAEPVLFPTARPHPFDPPEELGLLRTVWPACRLRYPDGKIGWLILSHAMARRVLMDPRFSRAYDAARRPYPISDSGGSQDFTDPAGAEKTAKVKTGNFQGMDAPYHSRFRGLFSSHFSPRGIVRLHDAIERIVEERLDAIAAAPHPVDLVREFASPIAARAQCAAFGLPDRDADHVLVVGAVERSVFDGSHPAVDLLDAQIEFREYLRRVVHARRQCPGADVISHLASQTGLTDDEIVGSIGFVFENDTAVSLIATSVFALLCNQGAMHALRTGSVPIESAIEELLRYLSVKQFASTRTATVDIRLGPISIRAGEHVTVSLSAGNRDPEQFDRPDELRLDSDARGHLAFGHGVHICLGQHLVRLETRLALAGLIRRFPSLRLATPAGDVPIYDGRHLVYGVRELPVLW